MPSWLTAIALFAVFPILVNTQQGVRLVDPQLMEVARSFCTGERQLWLHVLVPGALPMIFAGIRLAIPRALVGMIVAEFLTSIGHGLGSLIITYQNVFRVDRMLVPVLVVALIGVLLMGGVQWMERRFVPTKGMTCSSPCHDMVRHNSTFFATVCTIR